MTEIEGATRAPQPPDSQDRPAPGGARPRLRGVLALAASCLAGGLLWLGARSPEPEAAPTPNVLPVRVIDVVLAESFALTERLAGRVVSRRRSELGFERNGRVAEIHVDQGDRVEAGALLAKLDTRELEAARRELAARLASTRARLELARLTADRQRRLRDSDHVSPQTLDEALANEATLAAQLAADGAALERTEVALALSELRAPYPAVIAERLLDEVTVAAPGQTVLSILEAGAYEVQLGVPPEVASQLEIGRDYEVENDVVALHATLRRLAPELDQATRTQTAILEVDPQTPAAAGLADGSLVWVSFEREIPARGSWVPLGALAEGRRGTWTAFAVVDDAQGGARIERRVVEIIQTEALRAYVRGTLREGDRLVADGLHRLTPGLRVRIASPAVPSLDLRS